MMKPEEMMEAIRSKNKLLIEQTKRIALVEEKIAELRKKFFQLKYAGFIKQLKGHA